MQCIVHEWPRPYGVVLMCAVSSHMPQALMRPAYDVQWTCTSMTNSSRGFSWPKPQLAMLLSSMRMGAAACGFTQEQSTKMEMIPCGSVSRHGTE